MREMDLVMGQFADAQLPDMSEAELDEFERLLDVARPVGVGLDHRRGTCSRPIRYAFVRTAATGAARGSGEGSVETVNKPVQPASLFAQAVTRLAEGGALTLASAPEGFDAFVVADIAAGLAKAGEERAVALCFVARDGQRAQSFIDALAFAAPQVEALYLPSWDCQPYDRVSPNAAISAQRMTVLARLARTRGALERPARAGDHGQCAGAARAAAGLCRRRRLFGRARQ